MKNKLLITILLLLSFLGNAQSGLLVAEDFLVKDVNAHSHQLFQYLNAGKIVVLPFFTTTCGSCNIYTPEIVLSCEDFGCNQGDVYYLGVNWGSDNIGVTDFISVHAVNYPCASGDEGLGDIVNEQYEIASHITTLVITPDRGIAGHFYGPNYYPTRDTLNSLLLSLGAQMGNCTVSIEEVNQLANASISIHPNPAGKNPQIDISIKDMGLYQLEIINISGQLVYSQKDIFASEKITLNLNLEAYPKGVYMLLLKNEIGLIAQKKFLKR